jgi:hypothetical protein
VIEVSIGLMEGALPPGHPWIMEARQALDELAATGPRES